MDKLENYKQQLIELDKQISELSTKYAKLRKEASIEAWAQCGVHIGDVVTDESGDDWLITDFDNEYWPVGKKRKKNGEFGKQTRNVFNLPGDKKPRHLNLKRG